MYTASGIYTNTSTNAAGCTHIDSLILTINYSSASTSIISACESYTWIDGNTYTASTSFIIPTNHVVSTTSNFTFAPSALTIYVGDTVTWNNLSLGFHNVNGTQSVFPNNPEGFGNIVSPSAWSYQWIFTIPGTYNYQSDPFAPLGMFGTISVLPLPAPPPCLLYTSPSPRD